MAYTEITKPTVGTGVSKDEFGDLAVDNLAYLYALRTIIADRTLNGIVPLTVSDKTYLRVPAKLNGATITDAIAYCKDGSTSGIVEFDIKIGATSIFTTKLTIDQSETDSKDALTPKVINAGACTVATGDLIEFSVTSPGTSVTFASIQITFTPAA